MIIWAESQMKPPPMLYKVNGSELKDLVLSKLHVIMEFPDFLCQAQAVERSVKVETELSMTVSGEKTRNGFFRLNRESNVIL